MSKTFAQLQQHLVKHPYLTAEHCDRQRTFVFIAGMSLDAVELAKVKGIEHYEERLLYVIGYLRNPKTNIVYVSSRQIDPRIIQYYFELFCPDEKERKHWQKRFFHCITSQPTGKTVTQKLLTSTRLRQSILDHIPNPTTAVLRCFNTSPDEQALAIKLGIPLFAPEQRLISLGSKSGGRGVFQAAGLTQPFGREHIHSLEQLIQAITAIKKHDRTIAQVVLKFNNSFSGVGNAVLPIAQWPRSPQVAQAYLKRALVPSEGDQTNEQYLEKFYKDGGIVEEWLTGDQTCSPSAQVIIEPDRHIIISSTHEQLFDKVTKQVYLGARFPSRPKLRADIIAQAKKAAQYLAKQGVIGPLSIDFMSVKRGGRWYTYPVEINLRKGGATHPFHMVRLLTQATRQTDGTLRTTSNRKLFYYAYDNISSKNYIGITPATLIELVNNAGLAFDNKTGIGVTLHLLGALPKYGKFGAVCVSRSPRAAEQLFLLLQRVLTAHLAKRQDTEQQVAKQVTVNQKRLVESFIRYAKISSPSHQEGELRAILRQELIQLGVSTRVDSAGNLIGAVAGQGEVPFLLCAHMDTVKPCDRVRPVIRGNTIMTDGTSILGADDKAGIAAIIEVLHLLRATGQPHPPLEIIFSTGEETFSDGISQLDFTKIQSPTGIVLDGGDLGEIDHASAYLADVHVTIMGKASHSGIEPEKGVSAIQIAASAIHHMKLGRVDADTTANIGLIEGGSIRNAIPAQVKLHGEVRSFSKRKLEDQLERMHKALEDAAEQYGGLLDISSRVALTGYDLSKQDPFIKQIAKTMLRLNITPQILSTVGATDANTLITHGIKAVNIGVGMQRPHTMEEHIHIPDMVKLTELLLTLVQAQSHV